MEEQDNIQELLQDNQADPVDVSKPAPKSDGVLFARLQRMIEMVLRLLGANPPMECPIMNQSSMPRLSMRAAAGSTALTGRRMAPAGTSTV